MAISVLLIDDDPDFFTLVRTLLQGKDYQLISAENGYEGIRKCKLILPEIVILDLLMPEMDGWEVCERIREFSNVPILILSALGAPANVARALDAGADDYLIKPIHASVLVSRMQSLIRRFSLRGQAPAA